MSPEASRMTMIEFGEAMRRGAWVLVPIGSTEEHGSHLPLGSDMIQAEYVCRAVGREVGGVVAPGIPYGLCGSTRNFPGTISLTFGTLEALVREVLVGYAGKGARKIAMLSGHAGGAHMVALRQAALSLVTRDEGLIILVFDPYDIPLPAAEEKGPIAGDGHAGSVETSVMLAIEEGLVRADRIPEGKPLRLPRFQVLSHPELLFPSGVMGETSGASRAFGKHALDHIVAEIVAVLRSAGTESGR